MRDRSGDKGHSVPKVMRNSAVVLIGASLLLPALTGITLWSLGATGKSFEGKISEYAAQGQFVPQGEGILWKIAHDMLIGSRFEGQLSMNQRYDAKRVNLYILKADPKHYFPTAQCNCAFVGTRNAILC